jgi:alpha-glucosidase
MGEELGLEDASIPAARAVDPGGRDGCRAPFPWEASPGHGWGAEPWLPFPPEAGARSVAAQRRDPGSCLHLYRRLLAARRRSLALRRGDLRLLDAPPGVLAFARESDGNRRRVAINFGDAAAAIDLGPDLAVEIASDAAGEGQPFGGKLGPAQALVLRPTPERGGQRP